MQARRLEPWASPRALCSLSRALAATEKSTQGDEESLPKINGFTHPQEKWAVTQIAKNLYLRLRHDLGKSICSL